MIQKISDFKIAEFLLRAYCKMGKTIFIDLPIQFVPKAACSYQSNGLTIAPQEKLSKTCFSIIGTYISFADIISKTPPQTSVPSMAGTAPAFRPPLPQRGDSC